MRSVTIHHTSGVAFVSSSREVILLIGWCHALAAGKSVCFVPLLPPKEAQTDPTNPLGVQLAHIPPPASVVALAELLAFKPSHPVECIGVAPPSPYLDVLLGGDSEESEPDMPSALDAWNCDD